MMFDSMIEERWHKLTFLWQKETVEAMFPSKVGFNSLVVARNNAISHVFFTTTLELNNLLHAPEYSLNILLVKEQKSTFIQDKYAQKNKFKI